jgi:hypothetical protein
MKTLIAIIAAIFFCVPCMAQSFTSGNYGDGLRLCYDSSTKMVTGYFESYTGEDGKFSCLFYIEGKATTNQFSVKTYFPTDKKDDLISGTINIASNKQVTIKLPEEHGGCWNVQHFADKEPAVFTLEEKQSWIQVRYVDAAKTYFHSGKAVDKKGKAYLVKGNVVCVERIEQEWAYCTYFGKKATKGWLKLSDLNKL